MKEDSERRKEGSQVRARLLSLTALQDRSEQQLLFRRLVAPAAAGPSFEPCVATAMVDSRLLANAEG